MSGLFVTLEGIEGCGKSTQAKLLAEYLKIQGYKVLLSREPGGPRISEKIREILLNENYKEMHKLTEVFLYCASRSQHTTEWIKPALKGDYIVICDRFYDSTYAYQGAARKISLDDINYLNKIASIGIVPDITFVIDLPAKIGLTRILKSIKNSDKKEIDRLESENLNFHQNVRKGFLKLAESEKDRIKILNGKEKVEVIHKKILLLLVPLLKKFSNKNSTQKNAN
ncbi:MAG: dTMP kinase [Candidatus Cloacimonetes bacterium]|nr:dTMP kinase [Candidatus Cloacimonadota bacterium]